MHETRDILRAELTTPRSALLPRFVAEGVDGEALPYLYADDLCSIGVSPSDAERVLAAAPSRGKKVVAAAQAELDGAAARSGVWSRLVCVQASRRLADWT